MKTGRSTDVLECQDHRSALGSGPLNDDTPFYRPEALTANSEFGAVAIGAGEYGV